MVTGWQLEKEWEEAQAAKAAGKLKEEDNYEISSDEEGLSSDNDRIS